MNYYFVGIGGIGMSGLAQVLVHEGYRVSGSDRNEFFDLRRKLKEAGIQIYKQDGSGIDNTINKIVVSKAVENDNPDVLKAKDLRIPICYRQDVLKELFNKNSGIAVAGTSGKTTVTGMIAAILDFAGQDFTVINGGVIKNYDNNARIGRLPFYCIETDESEGNLSGYRPVIGVLTNVGIDHMPKNELINVYRDFIRGIEDRLVINADSKFDVKFKKVITFGIRSKADVRAVKIRLYPGHSEFKAGRIDFCLNVPGLHNVYNALAAIAAVYAWGMPLSVAAKGLETFSGIKRRFELIGEINGVRVIDDYAHNPNKIQSAIETARIRNRRIIAVYQPHGYGPTKMFFSEYADVFSRFLGKNDFLFVPDIFYAGGTADRSISSVDLLKEIARRNGKINISYCTARNEIKTELLKIIRPGDIVVIMGARDNTLSVFGKEILSSLRQNVSGVAKTGFVST